MWYVIMKRNNVSCSKMQYKEGQIEETWWHIRFDLTTSADCVRCLLPYLPHESPHNQKHWYLMQSSFYISGIWVNDNSIIFNGLVTATWFDGSDAWLPEFCQYQKFWLKSPPKYLPHESPHNQKHWYLMQSSFYASGMSGWQLHWQWLGLVWVCQFKYIICQEFEGSIEFIDLSHSVSMTALIIGIVRKGKLKI